MQSHDDQHPVQHGLEPGTSGTSRLQFIAKPALVHFTNGKFKKFLVTEKSHFQGPDLAKTSLISENNIYMSTE